MLPLLKANQHIQTQGSRVNGRYRPLYHMAAPMGWINDPNGFVYFDGQYHLFYQFYPYDTKWGPMHWGHAVTDDFVQWQNRPVALAPDQPYDDALGCFSGTAFAEAGKLTLMYTGVSASEDQKDMQQQCLAESSDGVHFTKLSCNPVIPVALIPDGFDTANFRDPKLFKRGDAYYCLIGGRRKKEGGFVGEILLYKSGDMVDWSFKGALMNGAIQADGVLECPDIIRMDGKDVIVCCPQNLPLRGNKYQNSASSIYITGHLDADKGVFISERMDEIDGGFDFYAPQTVTAPDGRVIMTAWMNMWGRSYPSANDGWAGSFILPREVTLKNDRLLQNPVKEIEQYRKNPVNYGNVIIDAGEEKSLDGVNGNGLEVSLDAELLDADIFGMKLFAGTDCETLLYFDRRESCVVFDRSSQETRDRSFYFLFA